MVLHIIIYFNIYLCNDPNEFPQTFLRRFLLHYSIQNGRPDIYVAYVAFGICIIYVVDLVRGWICF